MKDCIKKIIFTIFTILILSFPAYADMQLQNEGGDIAVWVSPECQHDTPCYIAQHALVAGEAEADALGITVPFIGVPVLSWDFQKSILGKNQFTMHIQPLPKNAILKGSLEMHGTTLVIFRFNLDKVASIATEDWPITIDNATKPNVSDFPRLVLGNVMAIVSYINADHSRYYVPDLDVTLLYKQKITSDEYLPMKGTDQTADEYLNLLNGYDAFFAKRRYNCGTMLYWAMYQAWMQLGAVSTDILDTDHIKAAESLGPGGFAQWLTGRGWVKFVSMRRIP